MASGASVWASTSPLYCGFVRERVILRTSATIPIFALLSSSTNSLAGRVECPMVKNGCAICHFGLPAVLRFFLGRVVDVSFVIHVLRVHPDNSPADSPGLRIPAHPVTPLQSLWTAGHVVNPRRWRPPLEPRTSRRSSAFAKLENSRTLSPEGTRKAARRI